ncbi:MAG TPA: hypothetical protein VHO48_10150, partial [Anaerolineaceae bacterium]|nr:hypothetical protein [Anaerolineaceae bacterium]
GEGGVIVDPGMMPAAPETFMQKVVRALKGLIGLDSGVSQPSMNIDPGMLPSEGGMEQPVEMPAKPIKGG